MGTGLPQPPPTSARISNDEEPNKHSSGSTASPANQDKVLPLCWFWEFISSHLPWIYCLKDKNRNICSPEFWSCCFISWKQFSAKIVPGFRDSHIQNYCFQKPNQLSGGLLHWVFAGEKGEKKTQTTTYTIFNQVSVPQCS